MEHVVLTVQSQNQLQQALQQLDSSWLNLPSGRVLAQVYSRNLESGWLLSVSAELRAKLPNITVVGCSAMGIVSAGSDWNNATVVSLLRFDKSSFVATLLQSSPDDEYLDGRNMAAELAIKQRDLQGVLLLSNPTKLATTRLLRGMSDELVNLPIFGGLAGDFSQKLSTSVMLDQALSDAGSVIVAFYGEALRIKTFNYLGWTPFGEGMTVTSTQGDVVKTIDNIAAYDLYNYFIGIEKTGFFSSAMEFPLMANHGGKLVARVPIAVGEAHELVFLAQLEPGDTVQFGYGDVNSILSDLSFARHDLISFGPEAILVFSCCCRQSFLQDDPRAEIQPFEDVAAVAGFFTYGEIDTANVPRDVLNATIVSVGFSEEPAPAAEEDDWLITERAEMKMSRNLNRLQRLMCFISRMTEKLNAKNQELTRLAQLDSLTGVLNRRAFEEQLAQEFQHCRMISAPLSLLKIDLDGFKQLNEDFGHAIGDQLLCNLVDIVNRCVRHTDGFARYESDCFMLLLPQLHYGEALVIAERIRAGVAQSLTIKGIPELPKVTCSIGVAKFHDEQDTLDALLSRVDFAISRAKSAGRNCVKGE
ncbi:diguanylate cyclase [Shewanella avicenniae]|uniref:diguanylate cyclase n=1 Tax=Shewanella avicenniae TaxID=2814294 RepID=A0ABX7QRC5_9GAMM|nr:diguanylate cyclase [Shewanella avicenniae]QSX33260.1 diguanylate cyclase [Shewanella avicenniae]